MEQENTPETEIVKEIPKVAEDIKKNLKTKNLILGTERVIKSLKQGKLSKIFLASNVKEETEQDLKYYSGLSGVELIKLEMPNDELGTYCKKTFSVSVIGLVK
jgi:ribosomal protein L30E